MQMLGFDDAETTVRSHRIGRRGKSSDVGAHATSSAQACSSGPSVASGWWRWSDRKRSGADRDGPPESSHRPVTPWARSMSSPAWLKSADDTASGHSGGSTLIWAGPANCAHLHDEALFDEQCEGLHGRGQRAGRRSL